MKRLLILIALLILGLSGPVPAAPQSGNLAAGFAAPPQTAKPWVYWFWSDGNITREGITADLEAMKRTGIGGVLIMEVDQGPPKGPARFMGPQWRELFKFVLQEAACLGIEVNMNNDAGWCGSGGPWITPANSMQKVVWTESFVKGPASVQNVLPRPEAVMDYYDDIAVIAFPSPAGEGQRIADAQPKVTSNLKQGFDGARLIDGDPSTAVVFPAPERGRPYTIQFEFAKPYPARHLGLTIPVAARQGYIGGIQTSTDGAQWRPLAAFNQNGGGVASFAPTESKFYRIVFNSITTTTLTNLRVCDIALDMSERIEGFTAKSGLGVTAFDPDVKPVGPEATVDPAQVIDLTSKMDGSGRLNWAAPEGRWTVLRLGHTSTGKDNHPAPEEGRGLECDKLSTAGITSQFDGLVKKLLEDSGPDAHKTMTYTHIDSWEVGCQNWTTAMREEFKTRRGYDLFPFLPAMTGRVVASAEASERFFWDLRRTISELLNDYYADGLRRLAHDHGMKLSIEAYSGGPFDSYSYSGRCDMPIGEFWTGRPIHASLKPMAAGGHIYGNPIIAAESFTASNTDGRQKNHPGSIKALGDQAFCAGINRFIFHRYSLQPWVKPVRAPGMTMGPWGLEYERTATWWEQSTAWHDYLARCQFMLQQGLFQADLLYLMGEEGFNAIRGREQMVPPVPAGYDYDQCAPEVILNRTRVRNGRLAVQGGMSYRVLVLPSAGVMTPELLAKIKELVEAGAVVVGAPPLKSPSYVSYPRCDEQVKALAAALWGDCNGKTVTEHACGKGKVYWGVTLDTVLRGQRLAPDYAFQTADPAPAFSAIHRAVDGSHVYFVANGAPRPVQAVCSFRVRGLRPELWHPDTGVIEPVLVYKADRSGVRVPIRFDPSGSVFVVFRKDAAAEPGSVTQVALEGKPLLDTAWKRQTSAAIADNNANVSNTFTIAAWVAPEIATSLHRQSKTGTVNSINRRNDLVFPAPGHEIYAPPGQKYATDQTCAGIAVGTNGVAVYEHGDSILAPVLVAPAALTAKTHLAVVYQDGVPSLYLNGKFIKKGLKTGRTVHPATGVSHARGVTPFKGECTGLRQINKALTAREIGRLMRQTSTDAVVVPPLPPVLTRNAAGTLQAAAALAGRYTLQTADGKTLQAEAPAPAVQALEGPWEVSFPPNLGAPPKITLEKLASWSEHPEAGVKYFSGTATYRKTFSVDQAAMGKPQSAIVLDLGDVQVSARVRLNGRELGILWKKPYRMDVTQALRSGENKLEVEVVNLWINRLIGDEQLPEDAVFKIENRARGEVLAEYPKWLQEGKPSPTGRITFKTWKHYGKDDPLVPSGLLGPVRLEIQKVFAFPAP